MKVLFTADIAKDPNLPELDRKVNVMVGNIDGQNEKMDIIFEVAYFIDGVETGFKPRITEVIDNNRTMLVRNENFQPTPNPDYDTEEGNEEFLTALGFNYMIELLFTSGIPLNVILPAHINEMVADGKFNNL